MASIETRNAFEISKMPLRDVFALASCCCSILSFGYGTCQQMAGSGSGAALLFVLAPVFAGLSVYSGAPWIRRAWNSVKMYQLLQATARSLDKELDEIFLKKRDLRSRSAEGEVYDSLKGHLHSMKGAISDEEFQSIFTSAEKLLQRLKSMVMVTQSLDDFVAPLNWLASHTELPRIHHQASQNGEVVLHTDLTTPLQQLESAFTQAVGHKATVCVKMVDKDDKTRFRSFFSGNPAAGRAGVDCYLPISDSVWGAAFRTGTHFIYASPSDASIACFTKDSWKEHFRHARSGIVFPVMAGHQSIAVLNVDANRDGCFNESHLPLVKVAAMIVKTSLQLGCLLEGPIFGANKNGNGVQESTQAVGGGPGMPR